MANEADYEDVEAIIRMRRDARLADSKKTEGWSRGFTPNSSSGGPEHVEIRLKDQGQGESSPPSDPEFTPFAEHTETPRQKTREQEDLEEALGLLLMLAVLKATEWAKPRIQRLWSEHVIPYFIGKRERWLERRAQRRLRQQDASEESTTFALATHLDPTNVVSDALGVYEATMTSTEARQPFIEALVAQHFADVKIRLLAQAHVEDASFPSEMAGAIQMLTPTQVEHALNSMLASKPTLVGDLESFLQANRNEGQLQLGSEEMKAVLRLTGDGSVAEQ
ncbi:hypothetical protein LTI14_02150 [Nesterenkonia sp. YGD6]|uniref:hypothetical protein n=1 Tax=Nesterenkonia sp. YGD6 TaxID=2901231 RepID=UPI001F4C9E3C|nr:hypothetical protein [Nesterenkonia sp. YGD6]MCH8562027.1 hypothetical protein [Nesterenkonia sp. YGD6]